MADGYDRMTARGLRRLTLRRIDHRLGCRLVEGPREHCKNDHRSALVQLGNDSVESRGLDFSPLRPNSGPTSRRRQPEAASSWRRGQIGPTVFLRLTILAQPRQHRRQQRACAWRPRGPPLRLVERVFARQRRPSGAQGLHAHHWRRTPDRSGAVPGCGPGRTRPQVDRNNDVAHAASSKLRRSARESPSSSGPVRSNSTARLDSGGSGSHGRRSSSAT